MKIYISLILGFAYFKHAPLNLLFIVGYVFDHSLMLIVAFLVSPVGIQLTYSYYSMKKD